VKPSEIYNLGAQSHVGVSFDVPEYTANVDAIGTLRILDAIKSLRMEKKIKFYQAGTSELYGGNPKLTPQNENTPFDPKSPYGVAKLYAHWITKNYRDSYKIFACNGILFNHESPVRGETFVTRKISIGLCKIKLGIEKKLYLGNIYAKRDWGHAKDFVRAMWLMLQQNKPDDFVIATGEQYSVKDFISESAPYFGMNIKWYGEGLNELGMDNDRIIFRIDSRYFRPTEVDTLLGNATKAKEVLGWEPRISFKNLVKDMCENEK
jgi:GDPmannose 4,6-dehydratase